MRCRICSHDFCWTCGSFGKGTYHEVGKPCVQSDWHLGLRYNAPDMSATNALHNAVKFGAKFQQIKDRVQIFQHNNCHKLCGYTNRLTNNAIVHAECAMLSAVHFLTNSWVMLSSSKVLHTELEEKLHDLARHVDDLGRGMQPAQRGPLGEQSRPPGRTCQNRNVHTRAYALVSLIRQVRNTLISHNTQDTTSPPSELENQ